MKILITGGAGYVGSHIVLEMIGAGHEVVIVDSLVNGQLEAVERLRELTKVEIKLRIGDVREKEFLERVFRDFAPDAVIHCAGLKSVAESMKNPILYYDVNVVGSTVLIDVMQSHGCHQIVFSSSATVYGEPQYLPYDEDHPVNPINTYGRTKLMVEQMLEDWCSLDPRRKALSLRYFNPVGAHQSGIIGEDPFGVPNNLMPVIAAVAIGRMSELKIFGDDYDTRDGTGERDYLHIVDLAKAHVLALISLRTQNGHEAINIGTGRGVTVKEMVDEFEVTSSCSIQRRILKRRPGDLPSFFANSDLAWERLGWRAELGLTEMCQDTWTWQQKNPNGFKRHEDS